MLLTKIQVFCYLVKIVLVSKVLVVRNNFCYLLIYAHTHLYKLISLDGSNSSRSKRTQSKQVLKDLDSNIIPSSSIGKKSLTVLLSLALNLLLTHLITEDSSKKAIPKRKTRLDTINEDSKKFKIRTQSPIKRRSFSEPNALVLSSSVPSAAKNNVLQLITSLTHLLTDLLIHS